MVDDTRAGEVLAEPDSGPIGSDPGGAPAVPGTPDGTEGPGGADLDAIEASGEAVPLDDAQILAALRAAAAPRTGPRKAAEADTEDIVRTHITDLKQHALLTAGEELVYASRIQAGLAARRRIEAGRGRPGDERLVAEGARAKHHMVVCNLRPVISIAKKYLRPKVDLLDLAQEGNTGLMRATDKFGYDQPGDAPFAGTAARRGLARRGGAAGRLR